MSKAALSGKYSAYPEYKDSGVEWIEKLPAHWGQSKLRYMYTFGKGLTITKENLIEEGVPCVNYGEVHSKFGFELDPSIHSLKCVTNDYIKSSPNALLEQGDLVFADTSEDIEGSGNFTQLICDEKVFAGYHTIIGRPIDRKCNRFYAYLLDSLELRTQVRHAVKGVKVFSVTQAILRGINIWLPSLEERKKIANFLDHETAKIDTLIEKQQQLIKLLKEKRQAVISHAVTKGLNPNAPMKDSGVEWLGEVPEGWEVKRLKNVAEIIDCRNKTPEYFDDGEYFVVRTTNIKNQKLNMSGALYTNEANFKIWTQRGVPPARSIFFTREAPAGEICLVPENLKFCMGQRMMNFICHEDEYTRYLFDFLLSDCLERYIESVSHGSTVSHLRVEQVENIPVIVPPLCDANAICEHLAIIKKKYLSLINEADSAISLMQERRTALISAAVTGKIDVRNWEAA